MTTQNAVGGTLYLISTPIGNLGDLSPRAREVLESVELVACEDTRRTGRLLAGIGVKSKLLSLHDHNERSRTEPLLRHLESGQGVAIVSDAGTPLVSDPGFVIVREAAARGIRVEPVPGPSALLAALVASALPPYPFTFLGFPPPRSGRRRRFFERYAHLEHTLVLFESPHRLLAGLEDATAVFGDRPAAVARELTKMHEEILRGDLSQLRETLARRDSLKGEFVIVIGAGSGAEIQQPPKTCVPE